MTVTPCTALMATLTPALLSEETKSSDSTVLTMLAAVGEDDTKPTYTTTSTRSAWLLETATSDVRAPMRVAIAL